jgi:DEAD/DEAH box helicase domain-containing protein
MGSKVTPLEKLLEVWQGERTIAPNIVTWTNEPARQSQLADFPLDIHPLLLRILEKRGIRQLYTHQYESWQKQ